MSLLSTMQMVVNELGLPPVSYVVTSTDATVRNLLGLTYRVGKDLRSRYDFPQLTKIATITLVEDQENYALPVDFERFLHDTHWQGTENTPLRGPLSNQAWMEGQYGVVASGPDKRWQVRDALDNKFYVDPTPDADDDGNTLHFMYVSKDFFRPRDWVASTNFSNSEYCWYNGNLYQCATGGTTGDTAPTHTTGSVSDGGVTWEYKDESYSAFLKDTDIFKVNDELLALGIQWRWLQRNRLAYKDVRKDYEDLLVRESGSLRGATELCIGGSPVFKLLSTDNVPDSGFGS